MGRPAGGRVDGRVIVSDEHKQFDPTPRELERAARRGQVAYSSELAAAIVLSGGLVAVLVCGPAVLRSAVALVDAGLSGDVGPAVAGLVWSVVVLAACLVAASALAGLVQVGWRVPGDRPIWDARRVSPSVNGRRLMSARTAVRLAMQVVKMGVIGVIGYVTFRSRWTDLAAAGLGDVSGMLDVGRDVAMALAWRCCLALLVLGVVDYLYQRWQLRRDLRMTRRQVLDDQRQAEKSQPLATSHKRRGMAESVMNQGILPNEK